MLKHLLVRAHRPLLLTTTACFMQIQQPVVFFTPLQLRYFAKKGGEKKAEKKEKEKEQVHAEFEGKDIDAIKADVEGQVGAAIEGLEEALKDIHSGRASPNMFDHLEIVAYGEKHPFADLCQVIVKGSSNLLVRVFDEAAKDDVIRAL